MSTNKPYTRLLYETATDVICDIAVRAKCVEERLRSLGFDNLDYSKLRKIQELALEFYEEFIREFRRRLDEVVLCDIDACV